MPTNGRAVAVYAKRSGPSIFCKVVWKDGRFSFLHVGTGTFLDEDEYWNAPWGGALVLDKFKNDSKTHWTMRNGAYFHRQKLAPRPSRRLLSVPIYIFFS